MMNRRRGTTLWTGLVGPALLLGAAAVAGAAPPTGTGLATPSSVIVFDPLSLTVTVAPGMSPTSTGLTVTVNLTAVGGFATQAFYDDGTHGDSAAGDNVFSYAIANVYGPTLGGLTLPFTVADAQARSSIGSIPLTLVDQPKFFLDDALPVVEGNAGTAPAVFTARLEYPRVLDVTLDYITSDGTASAGADYVAASGTLTFPGGSTSQTLAIAVVGERTRERDEVFFLNATGWYFASYGGAETSRGTILDDDSLWGATASMRQTRSEHSATLLRDGRVLVAGGHVGQTARQSAEIYDPASGTWSRTGDMATPHFYTHATLLPDGRVLLFDVAYGPSAELYDPATGTWTATGAPVDTEGPAIALRNGKILAVRRDGVGAVLYDPAAGTWSTTGTPLSGRQSFAVTLLADGRVLMTGGRTPGTSTYLSSTEIYDPSTGTWTGTAPLPTARHWLTATTLADGRVLAAGGQNASPQVANVEIYNPSAGTWSTAPPLANARAGATVALLPDGRAMVVGGIGTPLGSVLAEVPTAELYDPGTNAWTDGGVPEGKHGFGTVVTLLPDGGALLTGGEFYDVVAGFNQVTEAADVFRPLAATLAAGPILNSARAEHTATILPDGRILYAGGIAGATVLGAAEVRNPLTNVTTATGSLMRPRRRHSAILLPSGLVLVAGGLDGAGNPVASSELYDPASGTWSAAGAFVYPRQPGTLTLLATGQTLFVGASNIYGIAGELFDPTTRTWAAAGPAAAVRTGHTTTALSDGRILVAGGKFYTLVDAAEIYDPFAPFGGSWSSTTALLTPRRNHTATRLRTGKVLVVGGVDTDGLAQATTEIYDPATAVWSSAGNLLTAREGHTATLLASGQVLIAGGKAYDGTSSYKSFNSTELFDPDTGWWRSGPPLPNARHEGTATLAADGRVVFAGGVGPGGTLAATEVFDPGNVPSARRPSLTSWPAASSYGTPFSLTITGAHGPTEATSGTASASAVNHPLLRIRGIEGGEDAWLVPDPPSPQAYWQEPLTLGVGTLPAGLDPGWHWFSVVVAGVESVAKPTNLACSVTLSNPANQTVPVGQSATFEVSAQGARTYQWQRDPAADGNWTDIPGATGTSYTTPAVSGSESGARYRCVVSSGCTSQPSQPATLTISDTTSPAASVLSPSGGEYLLLSDSAASPNTHLVAWSMSDDVRVCAVAVELRYSTDGGTTFAAAPAGGGLPASFGPGGVCPYPGEATTSLLYEIPTSPPSGAAGSLYKVRVTVTDHVGLQTVAESPNPFYIVRANPDSVKTVILWNSARTTSLYSGPAASALSGKLQELSGHPRVQGVVVDLAGVTSLSSLYAAWDGSVSDPALANAVLFGAGGVHDTLTNLLTAYSGVKYLLLVGDDRIIPFARVADHTTLLSESTYADGSGLTATGTTVGQALAANKYLSDDPLSVLDSVAANQLSGNLFIPDLAGGRLVESPAEITQAIATFISQDGILDLTAASQKALVTGYDFLTDAAKQVATRWTTVYGAGAVDATRVSTDWGLGSVSQRVDSLRAGICGSDGLLSLSGHATHFEEGVPGTDPFDIEGLETSDLIDPNACGVGVPLDLAGRVVYAVGCHGGLPVTGSDPADHPLDLPETLLSKGVVAYVANTGYGWGLKSGIGYGERLEQLLTEELTKGGTLVVGDAVKRAKQRYYLETPRYDTYDEKSLMQWTLYGMPMYAVKTGIPTGSRPSLVTGPALTAAERPTYEESGGVGVERVVETSASQPAYLTQLNLHFDFTGAGLYRKWTAAGDEVLPVTNACPNANGCYYTLNSLADRATGAGDLPVQPYFIYDSRLAGTSQHGVLWKGGTYDEESNWIPVVGELVSNGGDGSDHGSAPRLMFTRPTAPRLVPGLDPSTCRPSDLELNSLTVPAGEAVKDQDADPSYTIERHYRSIDLEALYFNNTSTPGQDCDRTGPALGVGPFGGAYHEVDGASISWAVPASDASGVWRVLVVVNDNSTSGGQGVWSPQELTNDGSGTWVGSRAFGATPRVTYVIQAVDKRGNVTWLDYVAAQAPSSGVPLGVPRPVDVVVGPPVGPTVSGLVPYKGPVGITVRINGTNLAGATDVTFGGVSASITGNAATLITAVVPSGAVTGPVAVTTPAGTTNSAGPFTVIPPPKLSITDVRVREGNSGQRNAVFRVTLSAPSAYTVTVDYATSDGTAAAGSDYTAVSGTLSFRPFARARTISVPILGDTQLEGNETFTVTLTNPLNAAIARTQGKGTIVNDDGP